MPPLKSRIKVSVTFPTLSTEWLLVLVIVPLQLTLVGKRENLVWVRDLGRRDVFAHPKGAKESSFMPERP